MFHTSRDDHANLVAFICRHGFYVVLVIPLVRDLTPVAGMTPVSLRLLASVETRAAVHARTEDACTIARDGQIQNVCFVTRDSLHLTVVLAVVNPDLTSGVTRHEVAA